jgi:hypothetical protein
VDNLRMTSSISISLNKLPLGPVNSPVGSNNITGSGHPTQNLTITSPVYCLRIVLQVARHLMLLLIPRRQGASRVSNGYKFHNSTTQS